MNTENNHEDNNPRIAVGSALVIVGITFVGTAVEIISRVQPIPWWAILLLVTGSLTLVIGLLILIVPLRRWKNIWRSVFGLPKWFCDTYTWERYGPKHVFDDPSPTIASEFRENKGISAPSTYYTAKIIVVIKKRDKYPLIINLASAKVHLKQKTGWRTLSIDLRTTNAMGAITQTKNEETYQVDVSQNWTGGNWGRMSIVDTKPFMLPVARHSIFVRKPPVPSILA